MGAALVSILLFTAVALAAAIGALGLRRESEFRRVEKERDAWKLAAEHWQREAEGRPF